MISEIVDDMREQGYRQGAPSGDAECIDSRVCNESACSECGHNGMVYLPFMKGGSYRAFAVCPECGNSQEF